MRPALGPDKGANRVHGRGHVGNTGTWSKTSTAVRARRPFGKDADVFNYDVDSDDEWEEEGAGERSVCTRARVHAP